MWKHYSGRNFVKHETTKIMSLDFNGVVSHSRVLSIRVFSCIVVESQITTYVKDNTSINARL